MLIVEYTNIPVSIILINADEDRVNVDVDNFIPLIVNTHIIVIERIVIAINAKRVVNKNVFNTRFSLAL